MARVSIVIGSVVLTVLEVSINMFLLINQVAWGAGERITYAPLLCVSVYVYVRVFVSVCVYVYVCVGVCSKLVRACIITLS